VARRTKIAGLSLVASLVLAGADLAGPAIVFLPEQSVRTGPKNELAPAAEFNANGIDNLIWTERPNGPGKSTAYFRKGTNTKIKLNATGQGVSGSIHRGSSTSRSTVTSLI
jgi:hypothetical protein